MTTPPLSPLPRLPDWRPRLVAYLAQVARTAYAPGRHDCALFAAGAVEAMTGHDFAAPFRGRYTTLRGGLRVLRAAGHTDHVDLARGLFPACAVALALPGDLAALPPDLTADAGGPALPALGVVQGATVYVLTPAGSLGHVPLTAATEVFRI